MRTSSLKEDSYLLDVYFDTRWSSLEILATSFRKTSCKESVLFCIFSSLRSPNQCIRINL